MVRKKTESRTRGRKEVFVMQPAKDRVGMDGIRFSAAMTQIVVSFVKIGVRRIRNTGSQGHVRAPGIIMTDP